MHPIALCGIGLALLLAAPRLTFAAGDDYLQSVNAYLHDHFDPGKACIVIGLVDEQGSQVIPWGKLGNGTDQEAGGDSVFLIGSVSKTFTTLLLADMAGHGEVKLEDPAAKYLPASVKMPTQGARQITLLDLATHTSGLPFNPGNMAGKDVREQYETYTVDRMYAFLSGFQLNRAPGAEFEYSNVGMALLGQVLALRAGKDFPALVVERICRPLHMDSTGFTLTPEFKARLAMGHEASGAAAPPWHMPGYAPAGGVLSTANDLLKYAAAQAGITSSALTPAMVQTHIIRHTDTRGLPDTPGFGTFGHTAMDWVDRAALQPPGMQLLSHAGGAGSYHAFVGLDLKQHRGVVVLSTDNEISVESIGWTVLQRLPLTPESAKVFAHEQIGIGTALELDPQTGALRVTKVFPNSPAAAGGLSAGTIIQKINDVALAGKPLAACLALLRGDAGTKVKLELRDADGTVHTIELERKKFTAS